MSGLLEPTDAAALCGVDAQREAEAEAEAAAKTARAETADMLGSRLLGVERGTTLEAFFLRYKAALLAAFIATVALMIFGDKIHRTAGVVGEWSFVLVGVPAVALVYLMLRARPLALLIQRPAAWALVGATLCRGAIDIAVHPTVRVVCSELVAAACICVLPMVDAMPRELVKPFARYVCLATALLEAYVYCDCKFLHPERFATEGPGRLWAWRVADRGGREHEILSSGSLSLTCLIVQIALLAQLAFFGWKDIGNCLIVRSNVRLSEFHPPVDGAAVTVGDKLLCRERAAAVRRWLCQWQHVLVGAPSSLAVLSFFVDWVLERHGTAQAATDLCLAVTIMALLGPALACNRISVTKRALSGKPANWYYLLSCTLAWSAMLVWRGPKEAWTWWLKTCMIALLSLSVLFIDALPVEIQALLGRVGLPVVTVVSAATYIILKARTAEMYSEYDPPELHDVAGFVTLSSYRRCCNFLFFQALNSFYKVHSAWTNPGHAVFLVTPPKRNELYSRLYGQMSVQMGATVMLEPAAES